MKFTGLDGRVYNKNITRYIIDWDRKVSGPQKIVKDFLYPYWRSSIVLEEFRIPGSLLRCDLINISRKQSIEVSPSHVHTRYNQFFHKSKLGYLNSIKRDEMKRKWLELNNFVTMLIFEEDLYELSAEWFREKYDIDL